MATIKNNISPQSHGDTEKNKVKWKPEHTEAAEATEARRVREAQK
jgi:hypothetical protein